VTFYDGGNVYESDPTQELLRQLFKFRRHASDCNSVGPIVSTWAATCSPIPVSRQHNFIHWDKRFGVPNLYHGLPQAGS